MNTHRAILVPQYAAAQDELGVVNGRAPLVVMDILQPADDVATLGNTSAVVYVLDERLKTGQLERNED